MERRTGGWRFPRKPNCAYDSEHNSDRKPRNAASFNALNQSAVVETARAESALSGNAIRLSNVHDALSVGYMY